MSHRVTTRTQITDKALAIAAIKAAGCDFRFIDDTTIDITSGPMNGARLDLKTGDVDGSVDAGVGPGRKGFNRGDNSLGLLKRHYAEAKIIQESQIQGIIIEKREVQTDGSILLTCQGHFA